MQLLRVRKKVDGRTLLRRDFSMMTGDGAADLPFIFADGKITKMWNVTQTGDFRRDNATGRGHATALVQRIREGRAAPSLLAHVVAAIPQPYDAVAIGFFHHIVVCAAGASTA
jgi:hypothetical protein